MKYRKVFAPNPASRFDADKLRDLAEELVYVCDTPMFDDMLGEDNRARFEGRIAKTMKNYDPELDLIAFFGDAMIFAMMVFYASISFDESIKIARFSIKSNEYIIRELTTASILDYVDSL